MLKIKFYVDIGYDDIPEKLKEKKSFTIMLDENTYKMAKYSGISFKDLYENRIKCTINKYIDEIFEGSEYIKTLTEGE